MPGRFKSRLLTALVVTGIAALLLNTLTLATEPQTERISVSSLGVEGTSASQGAALSGNGRYVVFSSDASNLVDGDTNSRDIFVRDRQNGTTELVSVASDGTQANRPASFPAISGNGRFIVYESEADNLVPGDTNEASDIFCYDRQNGTTFLVSLTSDGSQANGDSFTPSTSSDGRYVTFTSLANNLVEGDTNGDRDVFVRDLQTGTTERISVSSEGVQGNSASGGLGAGPGRISGDGRYVVFGSFAGSLTPDDNNLRDDVFLRDRTLGTTVRASVSGDGAEGNDHSLYGDASDDGRYVVFHSASNNLVPEDTNDEMDIFLRDVVAGTTTRISLGLEGAEADDRSEFARISADGSIVTYQSLAANLVTGDTNSLRDIFVQELSGGTAARVSLAGGGGQANSHSSFPSISDDGGGVAYQSLAANLVPDDNNEAFDVFWGKPKFDPAPPTTTPTTTATPTATPMPTLTPTPQVVGDVDCSGEVTSIDAALVLQFVAGLLGALPCQDAADVNESGDINSIDAALILQLTAGFFESLPAGARHQLGVPSELLSTSSSF